MTFYTEIQIGHELASFMGDEWIRSEDFGCDYEPDGFYVRRSAHGYLDCTEWSGPFDDATQALHEAWDMYGCPECGSDCFKESDNGARCRECGHVEVL